MANQIDAALKFHADALNVRAQRQQVLASNIANADTPGYKARDIDFRKAMQSATAGNVSGAPLARTHAAHLAPTQSDAVSASGAVQYRAAVQPSLDGNTVDMDIERAQFAENALHYEFNLMRLNGQLKSLLSAIQG